MKKKTAKKQGHIREKRKDVGPGKPPKEFQFQPGVSGNPKGRPHKYVSKLGKEFGYTNTEIHDTMKALLSMNEKQINSIASDKKATALERAIAVALRRAALKGEVSTIETIITRPFGSPNKNIDVKSGGKTLDTKIDYGKLSDATLRELAKHRKHEKG